MKILIAEDENDARIFLERRLQKEGYTVVAAVNGADALGNARKTKPDLVISDIMMPVMDGFELCRRMKADEDLRSIPFLFYTATFLDRKDEQLAMELGGERFIAKPIEIERLLDIIKEVLEAHQEKQLSPDDPSAESQEHLASMYAQTIGRKLEKKVKELEEERRALQQSEEKYRSTFENAAIGIARVDMEGRPVQSNPKFQQMLGYSADELSNMIFTDFTHPEDASADMARFRKLIAGRGDSYHLEKRYLRKDGEIIWVNLTVSLIRNEEGQPQYAIGMAEDITERKRAQEREKLQREQLIQADKMVALGILVAGVAHEINNPNTAIMTGTRQVKNMWTSLMPVLDEIYQENGDHPVGNWQYSEIRERLPALLEGIADGSKRIKRLVGELKAFSRKENSTAMQPVKLNDLVENALALVSNLIKKSTRHLAIELDQNLPEITGNAQQLEQVIVNLLINACQALADRHEGIQVKAAYNNRSQRAEIFVRDEGVGIKPGDLPRVTDPFFTTKRDIGGTGLGLSISSKIITEHKGTIEFQSAIGKGTTVKLTFPVNAG